VNSDPVSPDPVTSPAGRMGGDGDDSGDDSSGGDRSGGDSGGGRGGGGRGGGGPTRAGRQARVLRPGALTTVQDGGRPGLAHLGVGRSGALDANAFHLVNRLVGNDEATAVLETTLDGVALTFDFDAVVAVTGALAPVTVDGAPAAWSLAIYLRAGQRLEVGRAERGVRNYVAIAGGVQVDAVLGSASRDLLSGLGAAPLAAGDVLAVGPGQGPVTAVDVAPYPLPGPGAELAVHAGPRHDWLSAAGVATLTSATWSVSPESNRIALRLDGPPVERSRHDELPSEGLVLGAIQSLPDGGLVVFLADHPTTGGYPVVAVVDRASLGACAQARPGTAIRFRPAP
jgi:biotin-dependent carboxylase-like uncharacterized protein